MRVPTASRSDRASAAHGRRSSWSSGRCALADGGCARCSSSPSTCPPKGSPRERGSGGRSCSGPSTRPTTSTTAIQPAKATAESSWRRRRDGLIQLWVAWTGRAVRDEHARIGQAYLKTTGDRRMMSVPYGGGASANTRAATRQHFVANSCPPVSALAPFTAHPELRCRPGGQSTRYEAPRGGCMNASDSDRCTRRAWS